MFAVAFGLLVTTIAPVMLVGPEALRWYWPAQTAVVAACFWLVAFIVRAALDKGAAARLASD